MLKDRNIYEVVDLPKERKAIKNHWIFKTKSDSHYKSWLDVKKFSQVEEINFDELFSSVVCYKTTCLFLAVAALENIHIIDVKTAYLYSDLYKKIYMEQSKGFRPSGKEKKVWQLY